MSRLFSTKTIRKRIYNQSYYKYFGSNHRLEKWWRVDSTTKLSRKFASSRSNRHWFHSNNWEPFSWSQKLGECSITIWTNSAHGLNWICKWLQTSQCQKNINNGTNHHIESYINNIKSICNQIQSYNSINIKSMCK